MLLKIAFDVAVLNLGQLLLKIAFDVAVLNLGQLLLKIVFHRVRKTVIMDLCIYVCSCACVQDKYYQHTFQEDLLSVSDEERPCAGSERG